MLNRGGYLRFTSFGDYAVYEQNELINAILHYYTAQSELLSNYSQWDANYVEEKVVGYYLANHTGNLRRYFDQAVLGESANTLDATIMQSMMHDDGFQSLQVYNFIIKKNYKGQLEKAQEEARLLLVLVDAYISHHD